MTLKQRADLLPRANKFVEDIIENNKIFYMLHSKGGAITYPSNEFFDENQRPAEVIPIWSSRYLPYAKKFADKFEIKEIDFEEFFYLMLPALIRDQMIIGLNWDHQGFGIEMTASEVYEKISGVETSTSKNLFPEIAELEEEELPEGKYDSMLSRKNRLEQSKKAFETKFLRMEKLPTPWKLYLQTDCKKTDKAHFCFGKKGIGAECKLIYMECPVPVSSRKNFNFNKLWNSLNPVLHLKNPLDVEKITVQSKNEELQGIIISTQDWSPVYGWFSVVNHPDWHFVFTSTLCRKKGDLEEIKKLLREVFVITD